jgi:hypothetical protein
VNPTSQCSPLVRVCWRPYQEKRIVHTPKQCLCPASVPRYRYSIFLRNFLLSLNQGFELCTEVVQSIVILHRAQNLYDM